MLVVFGASFFSSSGNSCFLGVESAAFLGETPGETKAPFYPVIFGEVRLSFVTFVGVTNEEFCLMLYYYFLIMSESIPDLE